MAPTDEHPALTGAIRACDPSKPLANFSPGPAPLPAAVMQEIQDELLDWNGTGSSVMSMSHRSPEFGEIIDDTRRVLRRVMHLPESHEILFTHGGGHGQFAAVPLNLCQGGPAECSADYIVNGTWGRRAAAEASKYVTVRHAAESDGKALPPRNEWKLDPKASYRYICSNETVDGLEFHSLPRFDDGVPLVVDMSSDICSKVVDWSRVGVAFACAPKNIGHAGLTVVIVRNDLLAKRTAQPTCPGVLNWRINQESGAMWNTPPTFNVYTTGKVLHWIEDEGGLVEMEKRAMKKSAAFYSCIEASSGFYATPVDTPVHRSRMNAPFCVLDGDIEATEAFLRAAYEQNMVGFRTKTPFAQGKWLRASFYTGSTVEQAETLVAFMNAFAAKWRAGSTPGRVVVDVSEAPLAPPAENPSPLPSAIQPTAKLLAKPRKIPASVSLDSGLPFLHGGADRASRVH